MLLCCAAYVHNVQGPPQGGELHRSTHRPAAQGAAAARELGAAAAAAAAAAATAALGGVAGAAVDRRTGARIDLLRKVLQQHAS
jgi:hypothetical protein